MRTLLIDNHDSYTYNLFQLIAAVDGAEPYVLRNDDPALSTRLPHEVDAIVVSPGPGSPAVPRDVGYADTLLRTADLPVLGVCLGHQLISLQAGAVVAAAPQPRHGHLSTISHSGRDLFRGVPSGFTAVRYHSLAAYEPLPADLEPLAHAEDGVLMAVRHRTLPRWGVQFHPESIASEHGHRLFANFRELGTLAGRSRIEVSPRRTATPGPATGVAGDRGVPAGAGPAAVADHAVIVEEMPFAVAADQLFTRAFVDSPTCYWLDSSLVEEGLSRFSFLGESYGPTSETLTYTVGSGVVQVTGPDGTTSGEAGSVFDVLAERLRRRRLVDPPALPFDLVGGYVGWFGYEMKGECGSAGRHHATTPDAAWIHADRFVAIDHRAGRTYVVAVHPTTAEQAGSARTWVTQMSRLVASIEDGSAPALRPPVGTPVDDAVSTEPFLARDQKQYVADVHWSQDELKRGESYEICLTNTLRLPFPQDRTTAFYQRLRASNPAPYSAFLRIAGVTVMSSSPERFLRIDRDRLVESKPIKGTAPRSRNPRTDALLATELASSAKTQAENLMIVDLLRNDLGRVCEVGSVDVTRFMAVESYSTVHQLVSTIRGTLRPSIDAVECVRACFPGGSMTGAPKERTMEIIDGLETEARGIYSGALGYFAFGGAADLNIVIRTAVHQDGEMTIGAGGAIVLDSDADDEYAEMVLKSAALRRALAVDVAEDVPRERAADAVSTRAS